MSDRAKHIVDAVLKDLDGHAGIYLPSPAALSATAAARWHLLPSDPDTWPLWR